MSWRNKCILGPLLAVLLVVLGGWTGGAWNKTTRSAYGGKGWMTAGSGPALLDTNTVIFSPETLVDAATDTFGYPTSGQIAADLTRVHYLNDVLLGRNGQGSPATFIKLGAGGVTSFAYANISNLSPTAADTTGYINATGDRIMIQSATSFITAGIRMLDLAFPQSVRKSEFVYIPFENYIPANSTIVSASVNLSIASAPALLSYTDSIIAQPLHPAWDKWMLVKDVGSADYVAHAAWTSQESTGPAGAWGGTTRYPWVPDLDFLPKLWDVSQVSDWTGVTGPDVPEKSNLPVYITNTVQSFVNGAPNTGFMMNLADYGAFTMSIQHYRWDASTTATRRMPAVIVKYVTKRYAKPFGSSDWALVFQTDDLGAIANKAYADTLEARGGKFTMFGFKQYNTLPGLGVVGVNDQTRRLSLAELFDIYNRGNEYGSHSKFHSPSKGYHNRIVAAGTGIASAAYDSMVVDFGPNWMYAIGDSARALGIIDEDMRQSPRFAKSFGAPVSFLEAYAQRVLVDHGYKAWRTLGSTGTYDRDKYYSLPAAGYRASADSAALHVSHTQRHVRNIREQFPMGTHQLIVGPPDSNSTSLTHLPKVVNNMKRLVFQRRGDGTGVVNFFVHDLKSGGSGYYAGEGVNADELGRIAYVTNLLGGRYMTMSELGEWYAASSTFIDHPFNASRPDTFQMFATDRVWAKPNGIDNRWIPSIRTPRAVANSFDVTAPPAPASALAYGQNGSAVLTWAPSATAEAVSYRIYRFFDNAADTVLVATSNSAFYIDPTAVNGSPHNYYVTAVDAAGNESDPTATITTTPGTIRSLPRPAYWAFWYQDPADHVPLAQADVEKLASFDMIVGSPHSLEGPEVGEVGFDGLLGRIRAINPDAIYLTYYTAFCVYDYWADSPPLSVHKRVWDYMMSLPDSSGFALDETGARVRGDDYPGQMYNNVMIPSLADTIAKILVETYQNSGTDGEWAGFFLDDSDTSLSEWMCNGNDCGDLIDFDQDGTTFSEGVNGDPEEKAAFKEWHLRLVRGIRREFAERGMQNRLVTANTTWGRKADPSPKDEQYMGLLDGMLNEAWNLYWPGPTVPTDTPKWDLALDWRYQLTHAQTAPPLVMWNARTDSSAQYMNEVLAYANGGLVNANSGSDWSSDSSAPVMGRRKAALAGGTLATAFYDTVAGNATADTLRVVSGDLVARMVMSRNAGDIANQYAVWPYLITGPGGEILSRSSFWELPNEAGPPPPPEFFAIPNRDREVLLKVDNESFNGEPAFTNVFHVYRALAEFEAVQDSFHLHMTVPFVAQPDSQYFSIADTNVTNGQGYCYQLASVDLLGQSSTHDNNDCVTPADLVAPPAVTDLVASGGVGFVDLDWLHVGAPADLDRYRITRRVLNSGDAFAALDSVSITAYQDESAISGVSYEYNVRAIDDDSLESGLTASPAVGSWLGVIPVTYSPPALVRALSDNPSGRTTVLVVAPNDPTGITGYTIYRGPWNGFPSGVDTAACIKRIGINLAPGAFQSVTFEDATANTDPDSAFQYTARALYSGHASAKYAFPAGAFSNGGFSVQVPVCSAFGTGTTTAVAVTSIAGADSTRIFRGVSSGTQLHVATVPYTTNPWYDPASSPNTDYWYKVRQVDGGVASEFSNVSGPVRWTLVESGNPTITGITGTITQGGDVVIAGSGFGSKPTAAPRVFDTVETGSFSPIWESTHALSVRNHTSTPSEKRHANSGYSGFANMRGNRSATGGSNTAVFSCGPQSRTIYGSYWFRLKDWEWGTTNEGGGDGSLANVKIFRLWDYGNWDNLAIATEYAWGGGSVVIQMATFPGCVATPDVSTIFTWIMGSLKSAATNEQWHHLQFEYVDSSADEAPDAKLRVWYDGAQQYSNQGFVSRSCATTQYPRLFGLGFYDSWWSSRTDDNFFYIDDAYYDTSLARVELGNASTYAACTHRELQPATAWNNGSISIKANVGSFANGAQAWLYVIDADGTPTETLNGYEVEIGAASAKNYHDFGSLSYIAAGTSFRVTSASWPAGTSAALRVRVVDTFTEAVVDDDTSADSNPVYDLLLTGLVVGSQYRVEYQTITAEPGYDSIDTWSTLIGPYTQPGRGFEYTGDLTRE